MYIVGYGGACERGEVEERFLDTVPLRTRGHHGVISHIHSRERHVVLLNHYASILSKLMDVLSPNVVDIESLSDYLRREGVAEECELIQRNSSEVEFIVKGCRLAQLFHKELNLHGYTGGICTIAMMALVVLAKRKGWKPGQNIYKYIKFSGELACYLKDGSITRLQI